MWWTAPLQTASGQFTCYDYMTSKQTAHIQKTSTSRLKRNGTLFFFYFTIVQCTNNLEQGLRSIQSCDMHTPLVVWGGTVQIFVYHMISVLVRITPLVPAMLLVAVGIKKRQWTQSNETIMRIRDCLYINFFFSFKSDVPDIPPGFFFKLLSISMFVCRKSVFWTDELEDAARILAKSYSHY